MFKSRVIAGELLDDAKPEEAQKNLADLVRLNQLFGGYSTAEKLLSRVVRPADYFSLLDVGAASGDTVRHLSRLYPKSRIVGLDCNPVNFRAASPPKVVADAFELPFATQSFDYVFSSLFLHHFLDPQVVQLLVAFSSIARKAVLISDLERHILPYWFLPFTRPLLGWHPITVHDGRISVRAAFTVAELRRLAEAAGLRHISVEVHRPAFRLSLVGRR